MIGTGWAATTYEAATEVFRNDELFLRSNSAGNWWFGWVVRFLPRSIRTLANNLLAKDGKTHRRLRGFVDRAFNRRNIDGMDERLQTLASHQLGIASEMDKQAGSVDLVANYARPFPLSVICELLGIPNDRYDDFHRWFRPISDFRGFMDFFRLIFGIQNMNRYLANQFKLAKANPTEGLISELVAAEGEDRLTDDELMAMVMLLFIAGHETTVHLISNCILTLAQHPNVLEELRNDWTLCDGMIDEVLRYNSPIQIAKPRFVAKDTVFCGQQIKQREMIIPLIASANYDPARFERPEEFNIRRERNYHLSFGSGPHTCLGMKLARSETYHALRTLYDTFPDLTLDFSLDNVDWAKRPGMRGLNSFRVHLNQKAH